MVVCSTCLIGTDLTRVAKACVPNCASSRLLSQEVSPWLANWVTMRTLNSPTKISSSTRAVGSIPRRCAARTMNASGGAGCPAAMLMSGSKPTIAAISVATEKIEMPMHKYSSRFSRKANPSSVRR